MSVRKEALSLVPSAAYLLDTHALIWVAGQPEKLNAQVVDILTNDGNRFYFSPASLQEIAIKAALHRADFRVDVRALAEGLTTAGYLELPVSTRHVCGLVDLPAMHKDPFDRLLVAQAKAEALHFITNDEQILSRCAGWLSLVPCG
ncbi:type II toxin-antitoxin system VapC family toxin [Erwinia phyllosphaerae]|uniref:type II toxin-antitoxin system VapC family toxin n=1 Tax=Erwinia phyllosphaerae TaxID=2853256 RepID=UPI001FEE5B92|nr:type II toxin-antitoxin system VapC family toxin [Erwinia phyllosphaerae]MBV4368602.1 type II toxin-antitoxin system VapC family toxin [Erwinia phyllosphaerae]